MKRQHYVTFYSPGTFCAETTTKPIENWDPVMATAMANHVEERYAAAPYGFQFETRIIADPVPDGEGGSLRVEPKTVATSGMYFLEATLETLDELEQRNDPKDRICRENMRCNGFPIVATSCRRWKATHPFGEKDFTIDAKGRIVERGDAPKHVAYRAAVAARGQS